MDQPLSRLVALIDRIPFNGSCAVFPFDPVFGEVSPSVCEALVLYAMATPSVPRRLRWEAAIVSAQHWLGRFDEECLDRAEALPLLSAESYVMERVIAHALRGRARLEYVRAEPRPRPGRDRDELARGARDDFDLVVALLEGHHGSRANLFAALVSAGNAWRTPPRADPATAIERYERAVRLGTANPHERARLAKCHADALVDRGEPSDLERAIVLLQESRQIRRGGPYEAATLLSLAAAESAKRQERTAADCEHVHRILLAAQRCDTGINAEPLARERLKVLGAWLRHAPEAPEPRRALDEIVAKFPMLEREGEFAQGGGGAHAGGLVTSIMRLQHPSTSACTEVLLAIEEPTFLRRTGAMGKLLWPAADRLAEAERYFRERSIAANPERLAALAEGLLVAPQDDATPGRLVGRARTLARLTLFAGATREAVAEAARAAESAIAAVPVPVVRSLLFMELATVWGPTDSAHPIQDFAEAARLSELAVDAAADDAAFQLDALLRLARATQHRSDGVLRVHRERATAIYEDIVRRAPALGADVTLASAQQNLAALAVMSGTGARQDRSTAAVAHGDVAERLGSTMAIANRAWMLTQSASQRTREDGAELLREALALFAKVPMEDLSEAERINVTQNRTSAETQALERDGRFAEAAQRWRDRLEEPDVRRRPDLLARTRHNLGDLLSRHPATCEEGLRILDAALQGRPLDRSPREHWETRFSIASALKTVLAMGAPWRLREPRSVTDRCAVRAARGAIAAARRLGSGDELARTGRLLCTLAFLAGSDADFATRMEDGWGAMSDALPSMLGDAEAEEAEAGLAEAAALRVFRARRRGGDGETASSGFEALRGDPAANVVRWMERAMLPQQRRLAARFARPAWFDDARWQAWGALLDAGEPLAISHWVEGARQEHADFLDPTADPTSTRDWLRAAPDRGAMALLPTSEGVLVAVETAAKGLHVALISPSSAGHEEWSSILTDLTRAADATVRIERAALVRTALVEPIQTLIEAPLGCVRLALGAKMRWLPPSALFPDAVLHLAPSIGVPPRPLARPATAERRIALIASDPAADLGRGIEEIALLSHELAATARVTTALGRGTRWGRSLGIPADGLVDRPPSPDTLFDLAADADVVILLAHGDVIAAAGPAMKLMSADGQVARVGAQSIAARSAALAGRHLVLLSCEAGFVESQRHRLGLLLGELLACGAASVTAASWVVPLGSALTVSRFVAHALAQGREPEEGLKEAIEQMLRTGAEEGPLVGGRITAAERRVDRVAAARAWATWRP